MIHHHTLVRIIRDSETYTRLYHYDPVWRLWITQFDKIVLETENACREEGLDPRTADRIVNRLIKRAVPATPSFDLAEMTTHLPIPPVEELQ